MRFFNNTCLVLCYVALTVHGNTEIVNFAAEDDDGATSTRGLQLDLITADWPKLEYGHSESQWKVLPAPLATPITSVCETLAEEQSGDLGPDTNATRGTAFRRCPHELWIRLDLSEEPWRGHSKFTLRASWPASFPTDFHIQVYTSRELRDYFVHRGVAPELNTAHAIPPPVPVRFKYARIRLVNTGVLTPEAHTDPSQASPSPDTQALDNEPVPFVLVLEPLHFGVLPGSVVPVLVLLVPILVFAVLAVPRLNVYLEKLAQEARKELGVASSQSEKQD
ncbi:hypothetical protein HGRIS_008662 [Hohenbuehelia grisea]|uniref:Uncharacterized protein n=1 Tax=Hohenbuehelia grisea TaxID=104357 RepID=A0ABR3J973_9AGAR